jgi:FSR family fosmidomycin resistance protein-like MFS transporter
MDLAPDRREYNMARWALAGSLGNLAGPMLAGAALAVGAGWRPLFFVLAVLAVLAGLAAWVSWRTSAVYGESSPAGKAGVGEGLEFGDSGGPDAVAQCQDAGRASVGPLAELRRGLYGAVSALRDGKVVRWLIALQFSDLMLDVFRGYVAIYLVEAAGTSQELSGLAVGILTGASLVGNAVLVRVLRRVSGLNYLRFSLVGVVAVYPLFLLWAGVIPKMAALVVIGLLTSGWYPVLKAQLYAALPHRSGTALALSNVAGLAGALLPLSLGLASEYLGLQRSMWLLLAGPLVVALSLRGVGSARGARADA